MIDMNLRYFISFDKYKKTIERFKISINHRNACDGNHAAVIAKSENE